MPLTEAICISPSLAPAVLHEKLPAYLQPVSVQLSVRAFADVISPLPIIFSHARTLPPVLSNTTSLREPDDPKLDSCLLGNEPVNSGRAASADADTSPPNARTDANATNTLL